MKQSFTVTIETTAPAKDALQEVKDAMEALVDEIHTADGKVHKVKPVSVKAGPKK
jgi:hypothetical protein